MVVGIGDVEFTVCDAETAGFIERRYRSVSLARHACSKKSFHAARFKIEFLDLVIVGIGDQYFAINCKHAQRMLQTHVIARAVDVTEVKQVAAHKCFYLTARDIDRPDNVRLAISDIKLLAIGGDAGRLRETSFEQRPVLASFPARTGER